ncbi:MAG: LEA type 2 family protein [Flavobacteriales bacterium]
MPFIRFTIFLFSIVFIVSTTSCGIFSQPREPQIEKITNVKVGKINDGKLDLKVSTKLYNPDRIKFRIRKVDLDILINGYPVGKITNPSVIRIPKETNADIDWDIEANLMKLLKPGMLLSVITQQKMKLELSGYIRVKKSLFAKNIPVRVDSPFEIPYR